MSTITEMASSSFLLLPLILTIFSLSCPSLTAAVIYNVVSFGAKPDGKTDSSNSILSAWKAACSSPSPSQIYVPPGQYALHQPLVFSGKCVGGTTTIRIDGTLVAPSDYHALGGAKYWLLFEHVSDISILGGILDGRGTGLWACKASGESCPTGATSLGFSNSENVLVSGLTSLDSQIFHIVINGCRSVRLQQVNVMAAGNSPNTDGIHVQSSTDVTILASMMKTGDDCVSVGPGTSNLWVENVACGPGHGISIGSLGKEADEPGVQNVTVKTVTFTGSQNGVRIKSWGRPSTGFVRNVLFQHATMQNVQNPIVIDQNYCPNNKNCPGEVSGVKITDVTYKDIHGTSATEVAVKFDCSPASPCSGIKMEDVNLTFNNHPAEASCTHAAGMTFGLVEPSSCF